MAYECMGMSIGICMYVNVRAHKRMQCMGMSTGICMYVYVRIYKRMPQRRTFTLGDGDLELGNALLVEFWKHKTQNFVTTHTYNHTVGKEYSFWASSI
jgi:hypothetical protein